MKFDEIQRKVSELVSDKSATAADYLAVARSLPRAGDPPPYFRKIKAAFLSSYTIQGLPEIFQARAIFHNLEAEVYNAPYAQVSQEILNQDSGLYKFKPQIIYIIGETKDFFGGDYLAQLVQNTNEIWKVPVITVIPGYGEKIAHGFDFSGFLEKIGKDEHWYTKMKDLGDIRLAPQAYPALTEELLKYSVGGAGNTKKCLVLDLDNTLWDGVVGEDGLSGIKPNRKLQEHILGLHKRGVILAINSKNNFEDAMEAIEKHPEMILRKNHFAAWRINWNNKAQNMAELANELSLGSDSFVFVDDDHLNLGLVRRNLPEVAAMHPDYVFDYAGFYSPVLTDEDVRRGEMYAQERQRKEHRESFKSPEEFLRDLKMEVMIESAKDENIPRISQLTQKTNQFNLTTRRYSEDDIRGLARDGWKIWTVGARDVFGDYGIVGCAMLSPGGRLDNFLLSCRVLGRGIETSLLAHVFQEAKRAGAAKLIAEFIPTKKNKPAENFLPEAGFSAVKKDEPGGFYEYDLSREYNAPDYIRIWKN